MLRLSLRCARSLRGSSAARTSFSPFATSTSRFAHADSCKSITSLAQRQQRRNYAVAAEKTDNGVVRASLDGISIGCTDRDRMPTIPSCKEIPPTMSMRCTCNGSATLPASTTPGRFTSATWSPAICPFHRPSNRRPP